MIDQNEIDKIKKITEDFFSKMTFPANEVNVFLSSKKPVAQDPLLADISITEKKEEELSEHKNNDSIDIELKFFEPQILIGEKGQTLFEIQKLLRQIINKILKMSFYLNLDINNYKKKKVEHLKIMAKDLANDVSFTKEQKILLPMSAYERRIIHSELSGRTDVLTESRGKEPERYVVIKPK